MKRIPKKLNPEKEEEIREEPKEKGDVPAMLLAAFTTIFLPAVLVLLVLSGFVYLLFSIL